MADEGDARSEWRLRIRAPRRYSLMKSDVDSVEVPDRRIMISHPITYYCKFLHPVVFGSLVCWAAWNVAMGAQPFMGWVVVLVALMIFTGYITVVAVAIKRIELVGDAVQISNFFARSTCAVGDVIGVARPAFPPNAPACLRLSKASAFGDRIPFIPTFEIEKMAALFTRKYDPDVAIRGADAVVLP